MQSNRLRLRLRGVLLCGGALLGDRIRMNALAPWRNGARVYMRSLATRDTGSEISAALPDVIAACKVAGFDLVIVDEANAYKTVTTKRWKALKSII